MGLALPAHARTPPHTLENMLGGLRQTHHHSKVQEVMLLNLLSYFTRYLHLVLSFRSVSHSVSLLKTCLYARYHQKIQPEIGVGAGT